MNYTEKIIDNILFMHGNKKIDLALISPNDYQLLEREIIRDYIVTPEIRSQIILDGQIRIHNMVFIKSSEALDGHPLLYEQINHIGI